MALDSRGSPVWLLVKTPTREGVLVPVRASSLNPEGALLTPFDPVTIEGAPCAAGSEVSEALAVEAAAYYRLEE